MVKQKVENLRQDLINHTCKLIQIPSVFSESSDPNMPFGKACHEALEYMLSLGESLGFRTKNIDGYCGYIEFGEGKELFGIIGHLDVVPEGENWTYPPFQGMVVDNRIYGRGAIDDKGPVMASLYAMKIVMDTCKVNKRVRLILGLNEENDWKCMEHYKQTEETPDFGFSPDADFPCIYAEKGLLNVHLSYLTKNDLAIKIIQIDDQQNAINVVPKFCSVTLLIDSSIELESFLQKLDHFISYYQFNMKVSHEENKVTITSYGISAHAAHPDLGTNAISRLLIVLYELYKDYKIENELLKAFYQTIHLDYDGRDLGFNLEDESGKLTLNVAQFRLKDNELSIHINLRIPIHTSIETIKEQISQKLTNPFLVVTYSGEKAPLYLSKEDPLINTLSKVFHEVTGLDATPIAIGGATYARAFEHFVSFGANMPGDKDMCHQIDEFIDIDVLIKSCEIYAKAISELCK